MIPALSTRDLPRLPHTACIAAGCTEWAEVEVRYPSDDNTITLAFCRHHRLGLDEYAATAARTHDRRVRDRAIFAWLFAAAGAAQLVGTAGVLVSPLAVGAFRQAGRLAPWWVADAFTWSTSLAVGGLIGLAAVMLAKRVVEGLR